MAQAVPMPASAGIVLFHRLHLAVELLAFCGLSHGMTSALRLREVSNIGTELVFAMSETATNV